MKIFIISLKNALVRRENILNQIASLGENRAFEFRIFDAVDGREEDREGGRENARGFEKNQNSQSCPPPPSKIHHSKALLQMANKNLSRQSAFWWRAGLFRFAFSAVGKMRATQ
ncbi:hypothetical protein BJI48_03875 [Helicobacter sp. 11S02596-1]|nr:hypothetical protein BJI48_03875 [Helicobacter sp. 11S02596-1]